MKNKFAFTLAEVLITLVIIGVVAALTIPTAINKIEKRHFIISWRKSYSDVSRALMMAKANNDSLEGLHATDLPAKLTKYINGKTCANNCIELENGVKITFAGASDMLGIQIHFDVNGDREPNRMGQDRFCGIIDKKNYKLNPGKGYKSDWGCADDVIYIPTHHNNFCNKNYDDHYNCGCSAYYLLNDN